MPAKDVTATPRDKIETAVKRYLAGESAAVLAKFYGISRPQMYNWINKVKGELLERSRKQSIVPGQHDKVDRTTLAVELAALKAENERLRRRLFEEMVAAGKL